MILCTLFNSAYDFSGHKTLQNVLKGSQLPGEEDEYWSIELQSQIASKKKKRDKGEVGWSHDSVGWGIAFCMNAETAIAYVSALYRETFSNIPRKN